MVGVRALYTANKVCEQTTAATVYTAQLAVEPAVVPVRIQTSIIA